MLEDARAVAPSDDAIQEDYSSWSLSVSANAVQNFADRLRGEKERARGARGTRGITFREIAAHGYRDHSQMVRAVKGQVLPTWEVVKAFLLGCGLKRADLVPWRLFWVATRDFLAAEQMLHKATTELSLSASLARQGPRLSLRKDWLEAKKANTPAELGLALRHLLEHQGLASVRQAAEATGVPKSTLSEWLDGTRVPSAVRLDDLLQAVDASPMAQRHFAECLDRIRHRRWSESAIDQLKELYPRLSGSALVWSLGKPEDAIREKIDELGLPPWPAGS